MHKARQDNMGLRPIFLLEQFNFDFYKFITFILFSMLI